MKVLFCSIITTPGLKDELHLVYFFFTGHSGYTIHCILYLSAACTQPLVRMDLAINFLRLILYSYGVYFFYFRLHRTVNLTGC